MISLRKNNVSICLITYMVFGACFAASAQTWEQMIIPYEVPSPLGVAVISKQYIPSGTWNYRLSTELDVQTTTPNSVQLLIGGTPGGVLGADGLVAGWRGDRHLIIGTPVDQPVMHGPDRSSNVEISYITYQPDLTKTVGRQINAVILQNVEYTVQEIEDAHHNIDCAIHVKGTDGAFYNTVLVDIVGHGAGARRIEGTVGGGTVSLKFSLNKLSGVQSPALTPTQAVLGDISLINYPTAIRGPLQERMSLRYAALDFPEASKIFGSLRDGSYNVRFSLTFGEQEIVYLVRDPITISAAAAYQRCEARTNVFSRLLGGILFHQ